MQPSAREQMHEYMEPQSCLRDGVCAPIGENAALQFHSELLQAQGGAGSAGQLVTQVRVLG